MRNLFKTLLEKTGITWFFSGVSVELPAYLLPNFRVVELEPARPSGRRAARKTS